MNTLNSMRSKRVSTAAIIRFVLHWTLLCIMIPMVSIAGNSAKHADLVLILPLIIILYCGTRLALIASNGSNRVVEITFWLYTYIFLGICAFLQIEAGKFPWPDHYSNELIIHAQILVIVGLAAFDLGRQVRLGQIKQLFLKTAPRFRISVGRLYLVSVLGIITTIYATLKLGAFSTLFLNRAERYALLSSHFNIAEMTIYNSLAKTTVYVLLLAALAYKLYARTGTVTLYVLIIVLTIFTAVENNPIATARFQVGTILLGVFFIFPWKKYKTLITIYGLIIGLTIIFPYADLFRSSNDSSLEAKIERLSIENPLAVKVDYDSFQQIMNGIRMVQEHGIEYGQQISSALLFWIPRAIWPDKAEPTGRLIAEQSGYTFTNLSAPLWIEFYVDGGYILVVCGFIFYGAFVRWADDIRRKHTGHATSTFLLVTIYAGYQIFLLRGSLMPAIAYLSPVIPILLVCGKFKRQIAFGNKLSFSR